MPSIVDFKRVGKILDRRIKLTTDDKNNIIKNYSEGIAVRQLAKDYNVSRRLIQFITRPEAHERNLLLRQESGGTMVYYDKNEHRRTMFEHRKYKEKLYNEGLI